MSIALEQNEEGFVIRLEGDIDITCSEELKRVLLEALSSRKELRVDLARATDLDITALQLLWSATREAEKWGSCFVIAGQVPENIIRSVRDAGFEKFPVPLIPRVERE